MIEGKPREERTWLFSLLQVPNWGASLAPLNDLSPFDVRVVIKVHVPMQALQMRSELAIFSRPPSSLIEFEEKTSKQPQRNHPIQKGALPA